MTSTWCNRGKCASDPAAIAEFVRKRALIVKLVVFETGRLSVLFYHALRAEGLEQGDSVNGLEEIDSACW